MSSDSHTNWAVVHTVVSGVAFNAFLDLIRLINPSSGAKKNLLVGAGIAILGFGALVTIKASIVHANKALCVMMREQRDA